LATAIRSATVTSLAEQTAISTWRLGTAAARSLE
jgi:hypothetical protein